MVGAFLYVGVAAHCHHEVVVGIDELLALTGYHLLHTLDVLYSHQVAGVGHGGMAVFFLSSRGKLTLLVGHEHHLVEHHAVGSGHAIDDAHEINGHTGVVHLDICVGTDDRRQVGIIHIHKAIHLAATVPMPMVSSSTLKLVIDTTLSRKFMEKKRSTYSQASVCRGIGTSRRHPSAGRAPCVSSPRSHAISCCRTTSDGSSCSPV